MSNIDNSPFHKFRITITSRHHCMMNKIKSLFYRYLLSSTEHTCISKYLNLRGYGHIDCPISLALLDGKTYEPHQYLLSFAKLLGRRVGARIDVRQLDPFAAFQLTNQNPDLGLH